MGFAFAFRAQIYYGQHHHPQALIMLIIAFLDICIFLACNPPDTYMRDVKSNQCRDKRGDGQLFNAIYVFFDQPGGRRLASTPPTSVSITCSSVWLPIGVRGITIAPAKALELGTTKLSIQSQVSPVRADSKIPNGLISFRNASTLVDFPESSTITLLSLMSTIFALNWSASMVMDCRYCDLRRSTSEGVRGTGPAERCVPCSKCSAIATSCS